MHPRSLTKDYEFRVYEESGSGAMTGGPCPVVVMASHEGFQWNEELFVSPFRRVSGWRTQKSADRIEREHRVSTNASCIRQEENREQVVELHLTQADCDIWP
ncbi:hypothetical protein BX666DRAFT_267338 [Dichotomocladium elegans]|nr:hypothetical protein BX666DRAFT_267338 [Dichotomocladium elegans]